MINSNPTKKIKCSHKNYLINPKTAEMGTKMGQIENAQDNYSLKPNYINNYIKSNCSMHL